MDGFPIQSAKVQSPPLRDDVLSRPRLIDWLHSKVNHRLVLVLAEAGYGKTTLLTDFASRTRLRTLWYRLDDDDRDWVTVLHHLVAAGREHDPGFAPRTAAMLSDTGVAAPAREAVLDTFLAELPAIAEHGAVLILDDFHLVDDAPDVKVIARELVARAPERMSIVIASRRAPSIAIARLRAAGEVAELRTDDLRFDADETAQLFSERYGRPLEPDVVRDLSERTEGWAASLQLVQAALRDRSPLEIRRFVRNLTGADQELYDYLAEEVVGDLPEDLQSFLMRTSILQVVTPELAEVVTGLPATEVRRLTTQAERYSLLSRRGTVQRDHLRYHPLVRDFLEDRLGRDSGPTAVAGLHRTVAHHFEELDWRIACHHYAHLNDHDGTLRAIDASAELIVAQGHALLADGYLDSSTTSGAVDSREIIKARADMRRGDFGKALARARTVAARRPDSPLALATLGSIAYRLGELELTRDTAIALSRLPNAEAAGLIGLGLVAVIEASVDADFRQTTRLFEQLRQVQRERGHAYHEGTTLLNLAIHRMVRGDASGAIAAANEAIALLESDPTAELASARSLKAWAMAHLGDLAGARIEASSAANEGDPLSHLETRLEAAELELWYGDADRARDHLADAAAALDELPGFRPYADVLRANLAARLGDTTSATELLASHSIGDLNFVAGFKAQQLAIHALIGVLSDAPNARSLATDALKQADAQGAGLWQAYAKIVRATTDDPVALNWVIRGIGGSDPAYFSMAAEALVHRLDWVGDQELGVLRGEMERRPERWLPLLRRAVEMGGPTQWPAARCLDVIGAAEDVPRLRRVARQARRPGSTDLGRGLARRVADRVFVEDLGRITVRVGARTVEGTSIRRKVLSFLSFLLTKPRFASTRDEVLDALWPDAEPGVALNSLNQTVYFLRRIFEPQFREDLSPGYLHHDSDVVWLDGDLVRSRSQQCAELLRSMPPSPSPEQVARLMHEYRGRFALDFAYEDWAVGFRDWLHAAYLQVMETAVANDLATGHYDRGIILARNALAVDLEAEQIELSLLRLLRLTGSHAAAGEQYEHYASVLRETIGVEPPPLDAL